jgi:mannose-6-phosphate isomerase-like protein (cupin superfamily)
MNTTVQMANAMALATNEGERLSWLGEPTVLKVTGAETAGHYAIAEVTSTPEGFVPLHVHNNEDEAFLIMDGEVDFTVGGRIFFGRSRGFRFRPAWSPAFL